LFIRVRVEFIGLDIVLFLVEVFNKVIKYLVIQVGDEKVKEGRGYLLFGIN
jgi:hypothetical protein